MQLPLLSPSLVAFFEELPCDLNGLFTIPQEAFIAELLGLGNLQAHVSKEFDHTGKKKSAKAPFEHGKYAKNYYRFVVTVDFVDGAGRKHSLIDAHSKPLFFPGDYWIRSAFRGDKSPEYENELPERENEERVKPKRWGKEKHKDSREEDYGDFEEVLQSGRAAYNVSNFHKAKKHQLFSLKTPQDRAPFLDFFGRERNSFLTSLQEHLFHCVEEPSNPDSQRFSKSVVDLDAWQKMLKAYCSLAFPESMILDETFVRNLSATKKILWGREEVKHWLQSPLQNPKDFFIPKLSRRSQAMDRFETYLLAKGKKVEKDSQIEDVVMRLEAFKLEKYPHPKESLNPV